MPKTVVSSVTYHLAPDEDNLILIGTDDINGFGNDLNNQIYGNSANNTLVGGGGVNLLAGGLGDDDYLVSNASDVVLEYADEGYDRIFSEVHYRLPDTVELIALTGAAPEGTQVYGNAADNIVCGNQVGNLLSGEAGADIMAGGDGNDIYFVENVGDTVIEHDDHGVDIVFSGNVEGYQMADNTETYAMYATPNDINNPHVSGTNVEAFGNDGDNFIWGNDQNNIIHGGGGGDVLLGYVGDDTLFGGLGDDVLDGGDRKNDLTGGDGFDIFRFQSRDGDNGNISEIHDFESGIDTLMFRGYGTAANGAFLDQLGTSDEYRIVLGTDASLDAPANQHIKIHGDDAVVGDWLFLA